MILVLRLLARKETIFHYDANHLVLFTSEGAYRMDTVSAGFLVHTPLKSSWYLLDSNRSVLSPPEEITPLLCFIVEAASPRRDRIDWTNKNNAPIDRLFMYPFTLSELLTA